MEMCVDNPREGFGDIFATHPSVDTRVAALVKLAGGHDPGPLALAPPGENAVASEPPPGGPWGGDAQQQQAPASGPWGQQSEPPPDGPWGPKQN